MPVDEAHMPFHTSLKVQLGAACLCLALKNTQKRKFIILLRFLNYLIDNLQSVEQLQLYPGLAQLQFTITIRKAMVAPSEMNLQHNLKGKIHLKDLHINIYNQYMINYFKCPCSKNLILNYFAECIGSGFRTDVTP